MTSRAGSSAPQPSGGSWRRAADRHVLDHAPVQRDDRLGAPGMLLSEVGWSTTIVRQHALRPIVGGSAQTAPPLFTGVAVSSKDRFRMLSEFSLGRIEGPELVKALATFGLRDRRRWGR